MTVPVNIDLGRLMAAVGKSMTVPVNIDLVVREACKRETLADALSYAATIENERAVRQALENHKNGARDPHTGRLWETCFRFTFERVLEAWFKTHDVVGEIGRLEANDVVGQPADVQVRTGVRDVGRLGKLLPLAQTASDQWRLDRAREVKQTLPTIVNLDALSTPTLDWRLALLSDGITALQSTDEPQMTPAGTEIATLLEELLREHRRCDREFRRRERVARGEIIEAIGDLDPDKED